MKHHNIEQNTDEWLSLRLGKFCSSTFKELFMSKNTAGYRNAIYKVVFERLTGESPESFTNDWMARGHELESEARKRYEVENFTTVKNGGFFEYDEWIGSSPDGLIGDDGLIEIKCPKYSTMIEYMLKKELPKEYYWQIHGQMFATGRQYVNFVAYHPVLDLVIVRVDRNEEAVKQLKNALNEAIEKAKEILKELRK